MGKRQWQARLAYYRTYITPTIEFTQNYKSISSALLKPIELQGLRNCTFYTSFAFFIFFLKESQIIGTVQQYLSVNLVNEENKAVARENGVLNDRQERGGE